MMALMWLPVSRIPASDCGEGLAGNSPGGRPATSSSSSSRRRLRLPRCPALLPLLLLSSDCAVRSAAQGGIATAGVNPAILEPGFCETTPQPGDTAAAELNTNSMDCARLMEFVFVSRLKVFERLEKLQKAAAAEGDAAPWRTSLKRLSLASSMTSAHVHIIAAIASQRTECFSEHVRLLLIVNLRRLKTLTTNHFKSLWLVGQDGPSKAAELAQSTLAWLKEGTELLEADTRTMRSVLKGWRQPTPDEARFYSHEADGRFSTMESLRRDTFEEWQMDKGLLRGLIRFVFPLDASVGDFGAGSGHYSKWLNDTGLVSSFAFDGSPDVELVSKGVVKNADLGRPFTLDRTFDWALSLEVAEHIPADFAPTFLRNLDSHATQGVVLSWSRPGFPGLGSANPLREEDVIQLVKRHTGLHLDEEHTNNLRASSAVPYLAESLFVFVRTPRKEGGASSEVASAGSDLAPGCAAEEGWIYAGNDVQMFSNVASAAACCDLCNSNDQCRFWTWSREDSHKDLCWIKATREYRINHGGFVSGARTGEAA
eukprot:TRINITY_DN103105_c0_g1_i1.p1 TRINITY_DN103105_c0_g1~~TRINITY_DN103105_c0_g1_i1.p1  ORF type:complete len:541 (-),score=122.32 TRINITY_DN103105_c0_g1_i1:43-1665(-)